METEISYTTLKNYGIRIYDEEGVIYESYSKTIMNNEIKKDIEKVYEELKVKNKKNVKYKIYTQCESLNNDGNFMIWFNISEESFKKEIKIIC